MLETCERSKWGMKGSMAEGIQCISLQVRTSNSLRTFWGVVKHRPMRWHICHSITVFFRDNHQSPVTCPFAIEVHFTPWNILGHVSLASRTSITQLSLRKPSTINHNALHADLKLMASQHEQVCDSIDRCYICRCSCVFKLTLFAFTRRIKL